MEALLLPATADSAIHLRLTHLARLHDTAADARMGLGDGALARRLVHDCFVLRV